MQEEAQRDSLSLCGRVQCRKDSPDMKDSYGLEL